MKALLNKASISLFLLLCVGVGTKAQKSISIDFHLNDEKIELNKQAIEPQENDVIKIKLTYPEKIIVGFVSVKYYELVTKEFKPKEPESQITEKYILGKGNEKVYKANIKGTMNPIITIPVKDFYSPNLSKLRLKILECTDMSGKKLHKNNKVYEFYMPLRRM